MSSFSSLLSLPMLLVLLQIATLISNTVGESTLSSSSTSQTWNHRHNNPNAFKEVWTTTTTSSTKHCDYSATSRIVGKWMQSREYLRSSPFYFFPAATCTSSSATPSSSSTTTTSNTKANNENEWNIFMPKTALEEWKFFHSSSSDTNDDSSSSNGHNKKVKNKSSHPKGNQQPQSHDRRLTFMEPTRMSPRMSSTRSMVSSTSSSSSSQQVVGSFIPTSLQNAFRRFVLEDYNFKGFGVSVYKSLLYAQSVGIGFRLPMFNHWDWWDSIAALPSINLMLVFYYPLSISLCITSSVRMEAVKWATAHVLAKSVNLLYQVLVYQVVKGLFFSYSILLYAINGKWYNHQPPNFLPSSITQPLLRLLSCSTTRPDYKSHVQERLGMNKWYSWSLTRGFFTRTSYWHTYFPTIRTYQRVLASLLPNNMGGVANWNLEWWEKHFACLGIDTAGPNPLPPNIFLTGVLSLSGFHLKGLRKTLARPSRQKSSQHPYSITNHSYSSSTDVAQEESSARSLQVRPLVVRLLTSREVLPSSIAWSSSSWMISSKLSTSSYYKKNSHHDEYDDESTSAPHKKSSHSNHHVSKEMGMVPISRGGGDYDTFSPLLRFKTLSSSSRHISS